MHLLRFDNSAAWVHALASLLRDRLRAHPTLRLCLPTGHTPNPLYAALVQSEKAGLVSFKNAQLFALDEFGGLAESDAGTCRNMLLDNLVKHVDAPSFETFNPHAPDLEAECQRYDQRIGPALDLVLLGIGTNGHLGLNEPGSPIDSPTRRVELSQSTIEASARYISHKHLPRWGLTIGIKQIMAAREVWVLANGARKADIIHAMVHDQPSEAIPASLLQRHPNCWVFVDAEAGSKL